MEVQRQKCLVEKSFGDHQMTLGKWCSLVVQWFSLRCSTNLLCYMNSCSYWLICHQLSAAHVYQGYSWIWLYLDLHHRTFLNLDRTLMAFSWLWNCIWTWISYDYLKLIRAMTILYLSCNYFDLSFYPEKLMVNLFARNQRFTQVRSYLPNQRSYQSSQT